jgi:hypothetical protein
MWPMEMRVNLAFIAGKILLAKPKLSRLAWR